MGLHRVADQIWLVSFIDCDLGVFDEDCGRVEPATNPFLTAKVQTMCLVSDANHALVYILGKLVGTAGFEPATTTPPVWCATRLRYAPKMD